MANYVKSANGYHAVVGTCSLKTGRPAHDTACGARVVKTAEIVQAQASPEPVCPACASPKAAEIKAYVESRFGC